MMKLILTFVLLAAACGPVPSATDFTDVVCPAAHPGVCITLGLPDAPVLFRPCDLIMDGVCQYRVFDDLLETDVDKVTTCPVCLSQHFDDDSVRTACSQYDFVQVGLQ